VSISELGTTGYVRAAVIELLKTVSPIDRIKTGERTDVKGKDFSMTIALIKRCFS
jgi:hypothetical protein